jgi:hypothetical protein
MQASGSTKALVHHWSTIEKKKKIGIATSDWHFHLAKKTKPIT